MKNIKQYIDFMESSGLIYNESNKTWYLGLLGKSEWFVIRSENYFNVITEVLYDASCRIRTKNTKPINNFTEFKKELTLSIKKYKKVLIELKKREIEKDFQ